MFAKAKVSGLRDSSAEGVPGFGSALRKERGAGKGLSVLVVQVGAVRPAGGCDRGLSARRSSRPTHGQKSRRRLEPGQAGPPRRGQVIMRCSWWWDSHSCRHSRPETPLTRLSGAVADGSVSSPARRCGTDGMAPKALGRKGASPKLGNRGIQRVLVTTGWLQRLTGGIFSVESAQDWATQVVGPCERTAG